VWLYFRFPLGLRMVEELLAARAHHRQPRNRPTAKSRGWPVAVLIAL